MSSPASDPEFRPGGEEFSEVIATSHVKRIAAKQGHYIPKVAYQPRGPFPPELYKSPEIKVDFPNEDYKWYYCNLCGERVREDKLTEHVCQED